VAEVLAVIPAQCRISCKVWRLCLKVAVLWNLHLRCSWSKFWAGVLCSEAPHCAPAPQEGLQALIKKEFGCSRSHLIGRRQTAYCPTEQLIVCDFVVARTSRRSCLHMRYLSSELWRAGTCPAKRASLREAHGICIAWMRRPAGLCGSAASAPDTTKGVTMCVFPFDLYSVSTSTSEGTYAVLLLSTHGGHAGYCSEMAFGGPPQRAGVRLDHTVGLQLSPGHSILSSSTFLHRCRPENVLPAEQSNDQSATTKMMSASLMELTRHGCVAIARLSQISVLYLCLSDHDLGCLWAARWCTRVAA